LLFRLAKIVECIFNVLKFLKMERISELKFQKLSQQEMMLVSGGKFIGKVESHGPTHNGGECSTYSDTYVFGVQVSHKYEGKDCDTD
jgi:hypothetical protein